MQGETINASLHREKSGSGAHPTINSADILVVLLVRRLQPWHAGVKKRLVKSRHYVRDGGITIACSVSIATMH
ncbi:MAG: hypothetical protein ACYYK0_02780 [Candidatus Eutrophobiaceae bacterium]